MYVCLYIYMHIHTEIPVQIIIIWYTWKMMRRSVLHQKRLCLDIRCHLRCVEYSLNKVHRPKALKTT